MDILIVSGFLGAGKTTFIKMLAQKTKKDFCVMENEYAGANIDSARLQEYARDLSSDVSVWELTEGCICCSMKTDFASSVLTIANTLNPDYLVVEPTGAAMLGSILSNISQIQYERIRLLSPVTIVDGRAFLTQEQDFPDLFRDQLCSAGTVLVSKTDSMEKEERSHIIALLQSMGTFARCIAAPYSRLPDSIWHSFLTTCWDGRQLAPEAYFEPELESLCLKNVRLPSGGHLLFFLEALLSGLFGKICRAKGSVLAGTARLSFDVAGGRYCITGGDGSSENSAVFIGSALKRVWLREVLFQDGFTWNPLEHPFSR